MHLEEHLINKGKSENSYGWGAGQQLEALRFYLSDAVEIVEEWQEEDYQGECLAIMRVGSVIFLWRDSFGSCSGCDALEGSDGYEYIEDTLGEGNTRQFDNLADAKSYIEKTEDWSWTYHKAKMIEMIDSVE